MSPNAAWQHAQLYSNSRWTSIGGSCARATLSAHTLRVAGALTRHSVERSLEKLERRHALARRIRLLALLQRVGGLRRARPQRERGARTIPAPQCAPALPAQRGWRLLCALVRVRGAARSRGGRGAAASGPAAAARTRTGVPPARVAGAAARRAGMPAAKQRQPERSKPWRRESPPLARAAGEQPLRSRTREQDCGRRGAPGRPRLRRPERRRSRIVSQAWRPSRGSLCAPPWASSLWTCASTRRAR